MILLQQTNFIRPYYINEEKIKGKIDTIVMYNDDGEIFKTRGWFEKSTEDGKYNLGDVKLIYLNNLVKRNKVNLTRKENFVIGKYDAMVLYIYADNKNISVEKIKTIKENFNQEYLLQTSIHNYDVYHVLIDNIDFYVKIFNYIDVVENEEKQKANELYEIIKNKTWGISKDDFYKIYNLCKIELREKPLIND